MCFTNSSRNFTDVSNPSNNTLGATAISPVPADDTSSGDINPVIGITGTPVIDAATNTLYLVAKTKETIGGNAHYVQRLHAINLADGSDRTAPFLIGDTTGSYVNNTPIYTYGTGDGSVTDPYNGTGRSDPGLTTRLRTSSIDAARVSTLRTSTSIFFSCSR